MLEVLPLSYPYTSVIIICVLPKRRYKILCPNLVKDPISPEKATEKILEHTGLDAESFRLGKTKVALYVHAARTFMSS